MTIFHRTLLALSLPAIAPLVSPHGLQGQTPRVHGTLNLSSNLYSSSDIANRRPSSESQAVVLGAIEFTPDISIPFELYLTSRQASARQPFNQIGISPTLFGWLTLHAGYYSSKLSDLTFGDVRLLGGGADVRPGNWRFSVHYGRLRRAIEPDSVAGVEGTYSRSAFGMKFGYGNEDGGFIDLNVVRVDDAEASIRGSPAIPQPFENAVVSLGFGLPWGGSGLRVKGEVAVSGFSSDTRIQEADVSLGFVEKLFTPRYSSQIDGAALLTVLVTPGSNFSLTINSRWIGPGYVSLGYAQLQNDLFETILAPSIRLLENRLFLRNSIGLRLNNLRDTRFATTRRLLGSFSASYQASAAFGLDVQYTGHAMNASPRNDTLKVDNTVHTVSVTPRFVFDALDGRNMASLTYAHQRFDDRNLLASAFNRNRTNTITGLWTIALRSMLTFTTAISFSDVSQGPAATRITSLNEAAGYTFFDNRLMASVGVNIRFVDGTSKDRQVGGTLSASYSLRGWGMISLTIVTFGYRYGSPSRLPNYSESLASLQYALTL